MTAIQRGRRRSTKSTSGSISSATTLQATTHPIVRWAATNTSRSRNAPTTVTHQQRRRPRRQPGPPDAGDDRPLACTVVGHGVTVVPPPAGRPRTSAPWLACPLVSERRLQRSADVVFDVVVDRAILLDGAGTELITLNAVGTVVWHELDGRRGADDLAADLLDRFVGRRRSTSCASTSRRSSTSWRRSAWSVDAPT